MAIRERAELDGQLVTVVEADGDGRNANVTVRNEYGYTQTVKAHRLKRLKHDDNRKTFRAPQI